VGGGTALVKLWTTDGTAATGTQLGKTPGGSAIGVDAAAVDFADKVALADSVTVNGTTVTFEKTVNGNAHDLTASAATSINLASLADGGAVKLQAPTKTLGPVTAKSISASGGSTAIKGVQTIAHSATYDAATVNDSVNAYSAAFGSANFQGGGVNTSGGGQDYGPVALGASTVLSDSSKGNINFGSTIDGGSALMANTAGDENFNGRVGGQSPLASLTTDGGITPGGHAYVNVPGTSANPSVRTTGPQTYYDNLVLGANVVLAGSSIAINGGLDTQGYSSGLVYGSYFLPDVSSLFSDEERRRAMPNVNYSGEALDIPGVISTRSFQVPLDWAVAK